MTAAREMPEMAAMARVMGMAEGWRGGPMRGPGRRCGGGSGVGPFGTLAEPCRWRLLQGLKGSAADGREVTGAHQAEDLAGLAGGRVHGVILSGW